MKLFLIIFLQVLMSCSSYHSKLSFTGSYEDNVEKFDGQIFAFSYKNNKYYFSSIQIKENNYRCNFYVGYKNNMQKYFFSEDKLYLLAEIYNSRSSPKYKIQEAIKFINKLKLEDKVCTKANKVPHSRQDEIATMVLISPFIIFALPLAIPHAINDFHESNGRDLVKKLRLGMKPEQIRQIFNGQVFTERRKYYHDYILDFGDYRLVLYFKNNKLSAFIFGYHEKNTNKYKKGSHKGASFSKE